MRQSLHVKFGINIERRAPKVRAFILFNRTIMFNNGIDNIV